MLSVPGGGYDWSFTRDEFLTSVKILNVGVSERNILVSFDSLAAGRDTLRYNPNPATPPYHVP